MKPIIAMTLLCWAACHSHPHEGENDHGHPHADERGKAAPKTPARPAAKEHGHPHEGDDDHGHPHDDQHGHPHEENLGAPIADDHGHPHEEPHGAPITDDHGHGHPHDDHGHGPEDANEPPTLSFTHWTETSELFIELPALIAGQPSPCAAHVTQLDGFKALAAGRVTVVLRGTAGTERFDIQGASVPGIFRPVAKPATPGPRRLIVEIRAPGFSADHDLGDVTVFDSLEAARAGTAQAPELPQRIPFLKEQQWPMAFGTAMVAERALRPALTVNGTLVPRSGGDIVISAPMAGRIVAAERPFPRLGEEIRADEPLCVLAPRLEATDVATLELAVTSASLEFRRAQRERERLEALRNEGAIPEPRLQDAIYAASAARAALTGAERRLDQFRRFQQSPERGQGTVELRAPLSGVVTELAALPGAFVEAGAPLVRITDLSLLWLDARIPEIDAMRIGTPPGASFQLDGLDAPIVLGPETLVSRGRHIDPRTRTLSIIFAVENAAGTLPVGAFARVHVPLGAPRNVPAIPESALVDDGGMPVVFVQVEGESFERRIVRLGLRDGGFVEVLEGVRNGERVVSRGAWSVKLAASSGTIPAHGHAH